MDTENNINANVIRDVEQLPVSQKYVLGLQHALAMFGATILVPILTGLHVSVTLFASGVGTLLFHYITQKKVPAYLGSSFAFIAPLTLVVDKFGIPAAQGGVIVAGLIYGAVALLVYLIGPRMIRRVFPPIVTGPIIMVIGLNLAPVAIDQAGGGVANVIVAASAVVAAGYAAVFCKGFLKIIPVIVGLVVGYVVAMIAGIVDFSPLMEAPWVGLPEFTAPTINWQAITIIAPVAIVSMVEHVGDILSIGVTVGKGNKYLEEPGIHRTLLGDGLATSLAGLFGGPPNTTYGENTGVLALTKVYDSKVMRIAAGFAILMALVQKIGGFIETIPEPVIGGISILLFGMIATIGVRTLVENDVDLKKQRNLVISATILVLGLGGAVLAFWEMEFSGMALAAIVGIILNLILPEDLGEAGEEA
ncbi:MAG: uracil-xanthine permease family protein [Halanaerobiales bacterium]